MSTTLFEADDVILEEPTTIPIPVTIRFRADRTYSVAPSFIRVASGATVQITWTIDDEALAPERTTIQFDHPAITMFGGADAYPRTGLKTAQILWTNDPSQADMSFYYRLHMFGEVRDERDSIVEYFAVDHDPTIHNEPPS